MNSIESSPSKLSKRELSSIVSNSFKELVTEAYSDEWQRITEKNGVVISKKVVKGSPFLAMKGTGVVQAPPSEVLRVTYDVQRVMEWDKILLDARTVRTIDPSTSIIYMAFQGKFPVAPRDFSLVLAHKAEPDGAHIQIVRSVTDEDVPVYNGFVRAELLSSGFIIQPYRVVGTKQLWSLVTYMVQYDPKGWLPTFVANKLVEYVPVSIARIRSLTTNYREADEPVLEPTYRKPLFDDYEDDDSIESSTASPIEMEEDHFLDASSDFTQLEVSSQDQFNDCLVAVQREMSYIQDILHKSQRRVRYLEKHISSNEHNIHLHAMEQRTELDLRIEEIKRGYQEKLLQIQEQNRHYDILLRNKEDMLNSKIKIISNRVTKMENTMNTMNYPFRTLSGRLFLIVFLLSWPWTSNKLFKWLKSLWNSESIQMRLFSMLVTVGGWVMFLKRVVAKSEFAVKALVKL